MKDLYENNKRIYKQLVSAIKVLSLPYEEQIKLFPEWANITGELLEDYSTPLSSLIFNNFTPSNNEFNLMN